MNHLQLIRSLTDEQLVGFLCAAGIGPGGAVGALSAIRGKTARELMSGSRPEAMLRGLLAGVGENAFPRVRPGMYYVNAVFGDRSVGGTVIARGPDDAELMARKHFADAGTEPPLDVCVAARDTELLFRGDPYEERDLKSVRLPDKNGLPRWTKANETTPSGEPQAWVELTDGTRLEVTLERQYLDGPRWFYSVRRHCSGDDFDNERYDATMGVMETWTAPTQRSLEDLLLSVFSSLGQQGIVPVNTAG